MIDTIKLYYIDKIRKQGKWIVTLNVWLTLKMISLNTEAYYLRN